MARRGLFRATAKPGAMAGAVLGGQSGMFRRQRPVAPTGQGAQAAYATSAPDVQRGIRKVNEYQAGVAAYNAKVAAYNAQVKQARIAQRVAARQAARAQAAAYSVAPRAARAQAPRSTPKTPAAPKAPARSYRRNYRVR